MYSKVIKRVADFIAALLLTLLLIIPIAVICIVIKATSKGPAVFAQNRTGKNGETFKLYKLRTMTVDEPQEVTPFGRFLRKTSIDELPQLINILKGDMSFIGPRPWITDYYEVFSDEQKRRTEVLPGLSGYAQINGRNDITVFEKIDYDIHYVENISFKLDIYIFFKTIKTVITSESYDNPPISIEEELEQLALQNFGRHTVLEFSQDESVLQREEQTVLQ